MKCKGPRIIKNNSEKEQVGEVTSLDFKIYYKDTVIKAV